jgi:Sigma 54 modulation/S30EA ribosomal protein C terminus
VAVAAGPAVARPAVAQATIDLNGRIVRAQAAGPTMRAAIEQMASRLQVRLGRAARNWEALHGTIPAADPGQWRHQSIPAHRPPYFPRPGDQRTVISRASCAARPETPDQAAAELVLLDYDFHLFTERSTGQDSVVYRTPGGYRLAMAHPKPSRLGPLPGSVTVSPLPAPRLTIREAAERLDESGQPLTFFIDAATGRGCVLYHRYDGHYGRFRSSTPRTPPTAAGSAREARSPYGRRSSGVSRTGRTGPTCCSPGYCGAHFGHGRSPVQTLDQPREDI